MVGATRPMIRLYPRDGRGSLLALLAAVLPLWITGDAGGGSTLGVAREQRLAVTASALGSVAIQPGDAMCRGACKYGFATNALVTLTAIPGKGAEFRGWSGACGGISRTCAVRMRNARGVLAAFAPVGSASSVPLTLLDPVSRGGFPVSSAVPFPRGALASLQHLKLVDSRDQEVPAQYSSIARWADGSYRSVLIDFLAQAGKTEYQLYYGGHASRSTYASGLAWTQDADQITITNGALRFAIGKARFTIFEQVWLDANADGRFDSDEALLAGPGDVVMIGNYGSTAPANTYRSSLTAPVDGYRAIVEEEGPARITVLAKGNLRGRQATSDGEHTLTDFEVRMHFYAGSEIVRVVYTLIDAKPRDMKGWQIRRSPPRNRRVLEIRSLDLVLPLRISASAYAFGGEDAIHGGPAGATEHYLLQDASMALDTRNRKIAYQFGYSGVGKGRTAKGWFDVSDGAARGVAGGVRWFWQQFPKELRYSPPTREFVISLQPLRADGSVPWEIEPNSKANTLYSLYPGIAKTFELYYQFHVGDAATARVAEVGDAFQRPPMLFNSFWFTTSGAFGPLVPTDPRQRAYDHKVAGTWKWKDRIGFAGGPDYRVYGNRDFGDYLHSVGNGIAPQFGNHHYDDPRADLLQFLRSGERKWLDSAEAGARHHMDWDVMHVNNVDTSPDVSAVMRGNGPGMMHWTHGAYYEHEQGGSVHEGHIVPGGLPEYYLLTGDKRALAVLREQSDWIYRVANRRRWDLRYNAFEEQRSHGWPLLAAMGGYEATGEEKYLHAASIIVANSVWWWQNARDHVALSPDPSRWPDVTEAMDWRSGRSAWITNIPTDNCPDGNYTVSNWMAQYLVWGHVRWLKAVKEEMGLASYSFDGTYLGRTSIDTALVEKMLVQNLGFVVDYQWLDTDYVPRYPWLVGYNSHRFVYSPCIQSHSVGRGSPDAMQVMPYLLRHMSGLPGVSTQERSKWLDVADKQYRKEFVDSAAPVPCGAGYNGAPCMIAVPHYLSLRFGN